MNLSNIFVEPKVTFPGEPDLRNGAIGQYRIVRVDGLICETICERRVIGALENMPNIQAVYHKPGSNNFIIKISNEILNKEKIESNILSKVVMLNLRRLLSLMKNPCS